MEYFVVVQPLSYVWLIATPWTTACQAPLSSTLSWNLLRFMSIKWCYLTILLSLPPSPLAFSLSQHQSLFQWVGFWHQVTKLLELQLQQQSSQWTFRVDFLSDWLVSSPCCQGTLKGLLQHHNSKTSILQCSAFFMVQLSHPYVTIRTAIPLTIWTFVDKVMSLLFNTLSRFVITFLPRNKHLWISYLKSPSTVILEPKKVKSVTASIFLLLFAMKWWDWMPWS